MLLSILRLDWGPDSMEGLVTDTERLKIEIESIKAEIASMTAENFALELVLKNFLKRVNVAGFYNELMRAFDDALKEVENLGLARDRTRDTIRIIEQMRKMVRPDPS